MSQKRGSAKVVTVEDVYNKLSDVYRGTFDYEWYATDVLVLDLLASSGRGFKPSVNIIYGDSRTGKTTVLLQGMFNVLDRFPDKKIVWFDAEHAVAELARGMVGGQEHIYDPETNPSGRFIIIQVYTVAEVMFFSDQIVKDPAVLFICLDSLKALMTEKAFEDLAELKDSGGQIGSDAAAQGRLLRKWKHQAQKFGKIFFMIQQTNLKSAGGWGMNFTMGMSGAKAAEFTPDNIFAFRKGSDIVEERVTFNGLEKIPIGTVVRVLSEKSRWANPFIEVSANLVFGQGFSNFSILFGWLLQAETQWPDGSVKPYVSRRTPTGGWYDVIVDGVVTGINGIKATGEFVREHVDYFMNILYEDGGFQLIESGDYEG